MHIACISIESPLEVPVPCGWLWVRHEATKQEPEHSAASNKKNTPIESVVEEKQICPETTEQEEEPDNYNIPIRLPKFSYVLEKDEILHPQCRRHYQMSDSEQ